MRPAKPAILPDEETFAPVDPFADLVSPAGRWRYAMLLVAVVAQLATLLIAWPAWNVRESPPNLPLVPLPAISFGWILLVSLAAVPLWPRWGLVAHTVIYAIACVFDQYRMQPQCISLIVLMAAGVDRTGLWFARWYLVALWLWAGTHKLLSPEWFGISAWTYLDEWNLPADSLAVPFAWVVAISELVLAVGAIVAPARAAWLCLAMHLVILLSLSPLGRNYNVSVWPWNLATAVVGAWILRQELPLEPFRAARYVVAALLIVPLGFYFDLVNPHLAFVLYSGNMPRALHTSPDGVQTLHAWTGLNVPFPDSPALFVQSFQKLARPGDKLFIGDPRWAVADRYYVLEADGEARHVTRAEFFQADPERGHVAGRIMADPQEVFALQQRGVQLVHNADGLVVAATISGAHGDDALMEELKILTNLRQLTIEHARVTDAGLATVALMRRLEVLEVKACPLSDASMSHIAFIKSLAELHLEDVAITTAGLNTLGARPKLSVVRLPGTQVDDGAAKVLAQMPLLEWVDLSRTKVTSALLEQWQPPPKCAWINLSETAVDDAVASRLAQWSELEVVQLAGTRVGDASMPPLTKLPKLAHLDLDRTAVSDRGLVALAQSGSLKLLRLADTPTTIDGVDRLRFLLRGCTIVE